MNEIKIKRGEIYYADLSPVVGSEQGGIRPVIILQNDTGNKNSPTTLKEKTNKAAALYYEICLLRLMNKLGYLDEKAMDGIVKIAEEDYGANLVLK